MEKLVEALIKSLPLDEIKRAVLKFAKEKVEDTTSPIDDHFVKVLAKLLDVDYDEL